MSEASGDWIAFSVDLEPNKDDTLDGVRDAMEWFDEVIPRGTVYTTYRIATELPDLVSMLAENHEIAVHVHPREFGHNHDQLAELPKSRQRDLISKTRESVADAAGIAREEIISFRAGRHSASEKTFDVLADLGFVVDASINVRYSEYLPPDLYGNDGPFLLDNGLFEIPTTYYRPPLLSRVGLRIFPQSELTATANTLRTDDFLCSGIHAVRSIFSSKRVISIYMHPYDATDYHSGIENSGEEFRERTEYLISKEGNRFEFVSASDLLGLYS